MMGLRMINEQLFTVQLPSDRRRGDEEEKKDERIFLHLTSKVCIASRFFFLLRVIFSPRLAFTSMP